MKVEVHGKQPLILAFVSDLMWSTKIENVVQNLDFRLILVADESDLATEYLEATKNPPGEPVSGIEAILLDKVTDWQPTLLIFDLANSKIPWQHWFKILKSSPATRRIPIICFGPHTKVEVMESAHQLGADAVLARSRFSSTMPDQIKKYARIPNRAIVSEACKETISPLALKGIEAYNKGSYFEAHEYLEDAWNEDQSAARELYRAILQVAVAYLQIQRGNYAGAVKMFLRSRQWIEPLPDICRGVDVAQLRIDAQEVYNELIDLGSENLHNIDQSSFQPILLIDNDDTKPYKH
jgi:predicted metal-dependent hydrolase